MTESTDLAERVTQACRVLGRLDLTKAATGHVSARLPGNDRILIRARGPGELGVRYTGVDQVITVDLDGNPVAPDPYGLAAPLEVFIHTAIYKARPEVYSVIHIHPPTIVLFTICNKPLLPLFGAYDPASVRLALEGIPTFDRSILINSPELGAKLVEAMGGAKTCLMRGHGITTAAPSVEQAALYAIWLNELAAINYHAHVLGDPRPISKEDQDAMRALRSLESRPEGGAAPTGLEAALWRYYCTLTGSQTA
jgi:ribulose-5-phosphate 4-epimerase/fuculose-1-phosphate aldolase